MKPCDDSEGQKRLNQGIIHHQRNNLDLIRSESHRDFAGPNVSTFHL